MRTKFSLIESLQWNLYFTFLSLFTCWKMNSWIRLKANNMHSLCSFSIKLKKSLSYYESSFMKKTLNDWSKWISSTCKSTHLQPNGKCKNSFRLNHHMLIDLFICFFKRRTRSVLFLEGVCQVTLRKLFLSIWSSSLQSICSTAMHERQSVMTLDDEVWKEMWT